MRDPKRGDRLTADWVRRILAWARRLGNLVLGPGLGMEWTPSGRSLYRTDPERSFFARLVSQSGGTTGPFRFRRVRLKPDNTWADILAQDDRAVAYHAGLQPVALDKIVVMREVGLTAEYRFFRACSCVPSVPPGDCPPIELFPEQSLTLYRTIYINGELAEVIEHPLDWIPGDVVRVMPLLTVSGAPIDVPGHWRASCRTDEFSDETIGLEIDRLVTWTFWPSVWEDRLWLGTIQSEVWHVSYMDLTFVDSPAVRCAASHDHFAAGYPDANLSPGTVEGSVYSHWACLPDAFGGNYYQVYGCETGFALEFVDGFISTSGILPAPVNLDIEVHLPDCGETLGAPQSGATVEITAGPSAIGLSDTTGIDGIATIPVTHSGVYTIEVTHLGCVTTRRALVLACGSPETRVTVCCTHVCVDVTGLFPDDAETSELLEDATVSIDGLALGSVLTDASGRACLAISSLQTLSLPPAEGTGCATRAAVLRVTKAGWVTRCLTIGLPCGRSLEAAQAAPETITLYGLFYPPPSVLDRYNGLPGPLAAICDGPDCETEGWIGQDLVPVSLGVRINYAEVQYDDGLGNLSWESVLPSGVAGVTFQWPLDTLALDGNASTLPSPFGGAQRVEWSTGPIAGSWIDPAGSGTQSYTKWYGWIGLTGARIRLATASYAFQEEEAIDPPVNIPSDRPASPNIGSVRFMDLHMDFTMLLCVPSENESIVTLPTGSGGLGFRYSIETIEGQAP